MSYPYSSFYLEAQWSRLKVAEHFDLGLNALVSNWMAEVFAPGGGLSSFLAENRRVNLDITL